MKQPTLFQRMLGITPQQKAAPSVVPFQTALASLTALADANPVNADGVLQNPTALAAIDTVAKTVAQQPFQVRQDGIIQTDAYPLGILQRPNAYTTSYELKYQLVLDILTHGQAFVEVRRAGNGTIRSWRVIPPTMVKVQRNVEGEPVLSLENGILAPTSFRIDNVVIENVFLIRDIATSQAPGGISRVELARKLISLDNAIDTYGAQLFNRQLTIGNNVIVLPEFLPATEADAILARLKDQFGGIASDNAGGTAVLEGGIDIKPIAGLKPVDADMSNLKQRTQAQIAGVFGVPAALIELDNGTANYNNVSQRYSGFYRDTVGPLSINITQKMDRIFGLPPGVTVHLDGTELLKGDYANQVNVSTSAYRNGYWTLNEARAFTGMERDPAGDTYLEMTMPGIPGGNPEPSGGDDEGN